MSRGNQTGEGRTRSADRDVVIAGGGLAGLSCAVELQAHGVAALVLEGGDAVGGRVRSDRFEGFLLDRGFQVLLTAYPEARRLLDFAALGLRPFYPGALVRTEGRLARVSDPLRHPVDGLRSIASPVGTVADKLRVARLRRRLMRAPLEAIEGWPTTGTSAALHAEGFSPAMIERFFRPFLGGVFLERELATPARMMAFVLREFALGDAALPAAGMGAIAEQLAARLPAGAVRTHARVAALEEGGVALADGERIAARAVVVATDAGEAARLTGAVPAPAWRAATCLYFAAERPPVAEPILVLDGEGRGPVNNLCVPSRVAPSYAPPGAALVSATVVGLPAEDDVSLERTVREQLADWFGAEVGGWRHLRTYRIAEALPAVAQPSIAAAPGPVKVGDRLYACGDYLANPSINGALAAGRAAAESCLADLAG